MSYSEEDLKKVESGVMYIQKKKVSFWDAVRMVGHAIILPSGRKYYFISGWFTDHDTYNFAALDSKNLPPALKARIDELGEELQQYINDNQ